MTDKERLLPPHTETVEAMLLHYPMQWRVVVCLEAVLANHNNKPMKAEWKRKLQHESSWCRAFTCLPVLKTWRCCYLHLNDSIDSRKWQTTQCISWLVFVLYRWFYRRHCWIEKCCFSSPWYFVSSLSTLLAISHDSEWHSTCWLLL